jgi:hypothetical protein
LAYPNGWAFLLLRLLVFDQTKSMFRFYFVFGLGLSLVLLGACNLKQNDSAGSSKTSEDKNPQRLFVDSDRPQCDEFMWKYLNKKHGSCDESFSQFKRLFSSCSGYFYSDPESLSVQNEQFEIQSLSIASCFEQKAEDEKAKEVYAFMLDRPDFQYNFNTHSVSFHGYLKAHLEAEEERKTGKYAKCLNPTAFQVEVESFLASRNLSRLEPLVKKPFDTGLDYHVDSPFAPIKRFIEDNATRPELRLLKKEGRCFWIDGWDDAEVHGICHQFLAINQTEEPCLYWTSFPTAPAQLVESLRK